MPFSAGPNIAARPNLVFEYDTGDVKNSYIGEPTTNYSSGDSGLQGNIDCTSSSVTSFLPNGSTGTVRRITITGNTYGGIIRAILTGTSLPSSGIPQGGVSYTISCWIRNSSGIAVAAGWEPEVGAGDSYLRPNVESGFIGNYGSTSQPNTVSSTWTRVSYTYSYNSTQTTSIQPFIYFGNPVGGSGAGVGATVDFYQIQIEIKSHATPYVDGTRSNTQGLLDVSGQNNTINLASVSFTSAAQPTFDGTDDSMVVTNSDSFKNVNITVETVIKFNTFKSADLVQFGVGSGAYAQWYFRDLGNGTFNWFQWAIGGSTYSDLVVSRSSLVTGRYYHIVCTAANATSTAMYYNGVLAGSAGSTAYSTPSSWTPANMTIGGFSWDGYSNTDIPLVRIYNSVLSTSEIQRNYNQLKGRFNLS